MHIADIIERDRTLFSFEFFPPNSSAGWTMLDDAIEALVPLAPSYVSVTYGAGGSTRTRTHELVKRLKRDTALDPTPHLTCVDMSEADLNSILEDYTTAGISNILAIRGDRPTACMMDDPFEVFPHAENLVTAIKAFNAQGVHSDSRGFGIGIAGFPEGHHETPNSLVQMDNLKRKVDAGADWICTQLFFNNNAFYDWRERCELAGITLPIIAGIMPIASMAGLNRMAELAAGTRFPAPLLRALSRVQDDSDRVERVGTHWATEQCRDLIDRGIDGIHFYTLNRSHATRSIFETLGAQDTSQLRP